MTPPRYWAPVQKWWLTYNPTRREQYAIITALSLTALTICLLIVGALTGTLHP